jgi:hypothetical protein
MSDLDIQIRDYFDTHVERVTADDVFAGGRLVEQLHQPSPGWRMSPRFATGFGFAVTVFVIGGSLALGLALRRQGGDEGSGASLLDVGADSPASTGWGALAIAAALVVVALVLMVLALRSARRGISRNRKEKVMATTIDSPTVDDKLTDAHRTNRWLIAGVIVLAVALVALGAWVISDLTASNTTEPPAEVQALLDDYTASWNAYDGDAFLGTVGDGYVFFDDHTVARNAEATARTILVGEPFGFSTELVGDRVFVVNRDGDEYVGSVPNVLGTNSAPESADGISVFRIHNFPDVGWKVIYHAYVGELPGP